MRQRQTSRRQSWHRRRALRSCAASRGVGLRISWPSMHRRLLGEDALDHLTARARARRYGLVDLGLHDPRDRNSVVEGKRGSGRVELGGRRSINNTITYSTHLITHITYEQKTT